MAFNRFTHPSRFMEDVAPPPQTAIKPASDNSSSSSPSITSSTPSSSSTSGSGKYGQCGNPSIQNNNTSGSGKYGQGMTFGDGVRALGRGLQKSAHNAYVGAKRWARGAWDGTHGIGYGTNKSNNGFNARRICFSLNQKSIRYLVYC